MPSHYAPLPNPRSFPDAEREMDDAFESDSDENESTPLAVQPTADVDRQPNLIIPGAYDFERDYDIPPPGSPDRPSAFALPNSFGNSNGLMPTAPIPSSFSSKHTRSFFRRTIGAILPSHYIRVPTGEGSSRVVGSGVDNDGVFANVAAKPSRPKTVVTDEGDVRLVPETQQNEPPPSYAHAQADAAPPYWDNTVHAPATQDPDSMIVDDLPSGSVVVFLINCFISFFFQFVGFFLTYLIHSTHAAKFGSRAGLGLTLIQFGYYSHVAQFQEDVTTGDGEKDSWFEDHWVPSNSSVIEGGMMNDVGDGDASPSQAMMTSSPAREWLSFLLMTLGWILLLSSIVGFWRVKRWEASIRSGTSPPAAPTAEQLEEDRQIRRNIQAIFGFTVQDESEPSTHDIRSDEHGREIAIPNRQALEEARLARDLQAAGLI